MTAVIIKEGETKPIAKMIIPGRRALGEKWQEVTIAVKDDKIQVTENVPAEAPATGTPIFTLGMGQLSTEEHNFILGHAYQEQEYRKRKPRRRPVTDAEIEEMVNKIWLDWCEMKAKALAGKTHSGPGLFNQRESAAIKNWSGVKA